MRITINTPPHALPRPMRKKVNTKKVHPAPPTINFSATELDRRAIRNIVLRAQSTRKFGERDYVSMSMDITATHLNGCPLDLAKLLAADHFSFMHDINGIYHHLDRSTAQLDHRFLPRCARINAINGGAA